MFSIDGEFAPVRDYPGTLRDIEIRAYYYAVSGGNELHAGGWKRFPTGAFEREFRQRSFAKTGIAPALIINENRSVRGAGITKGNVDWAVVIVGNDDFRVGCAGGRNRDKEGDG